MRNAMWVGGGITGMGEIPMLGVKGAGIAKVIRDIFSNGEQGFFYDPSDLKTLYQDSTGTAPVTAGQPLGLILDKGHGLQLGDELLTNGDFASDTGWGKNTGWTISGGKANFNGLTSYSILSALVSSPTNLKFLKVEFDLSNVGSSVTQVRILFSGALSTTITVTGSGKYSAIVLGSMVPSVGIQAQSVTGANCSFTLDNVSVKELTGNHAYQPTSAARPLLQTNPSRIAYDGVDDKLITNLPAPLTNATVLRAIPNVGTQVKYNQTLPMLYEDSTNHAGLIAIDRTLTRTEQLRLMTELDKRAGATNIETLTFKVFDNNQEGFVYDPNDLATLYQDAAGTVPVTAEGQPVGLILDKSKELTLGDSIISNGNFESDTEWKNGTGWSISNGKARFDGTGSFAILSAVVSTATNGKFLKAEFELSEVGTSVTQVRILTSGALAATVPVTGAGKYSAIVVGGVDKSIGIQTQYASGEDYAFSLDNVSFKELAGNHALQSASASRPILRKNAVTGANYLEFDGSDDFLVTNNIDFTATDKVSLFAGVRKLSDAARGILVEFSSALAANIFRLEAPVQAGLANYTFVSTGSSASSSVYTNSIVAAPSSNVITAQGKIGDNLNILRVNGSQKSSATASQGTGNYGNYPLYIGRRGGTSLPFNGHIYGLIGIGKLTSASETSAIEKEFAKRTGVTFNV